MKKYSVIIAKNHTTSISLEEEFYQALCSIAKEENITVSQADFGEKLAELSRMYQMDTATMIKQLSQTPGVFNALSQQALNEKVTQFLVENNTAKLK